MGPAARPHGEQRPRDAATTAGDAAKQRRDPAPRTVKPRLFFALAVDAPLGAQLGALALDVARRTGGRPVPAHNLHSTLAFLGSVARACIPALEAIGAACAAAAAGAAAAAAQTDPDAWVVALDRVGSFRRARVAWVAPGDVPRALLGLQDALAGALQRGGFPREARPWRPHVTLARHCRVPIAEAALAGVRWHVGHLVLYESVSAPEGVRYDALARWPLAGGGSSTPRATGREGSATHSLHDPG